MGYSSSSRLAILRQRSTSLSSALAAGTGDPRLEADAFLVGRRHAYLQRFLLLLLVINDRLADLLSPPLLARPFRAIDFTVHADRLFIRRA